MLFLKRRSRIPSTELLRERTLYKYPQMGRGRTLSEHVEGAMAKLGLLHRADGLFYNDLREPFIYGDITAVTLAATAKALYPAANFPVLGGQYFSRIGKALRIRLFGRMTTGATPGNGSFNVYYGTGADANGTAIMTGTPVALVANGTNLSWMVEVDVHARTLGAAGTLFCTGFAQFNVGLLLSTNAPMLLPASAPAASGAVDLTAANIISVQFLRSGSTAETMQVHNMQVIALN
jgi:hypothetical protein